MDSANGNHFLWNGSGEARSHAAAMDDADGGGGAGTTGMNGEANAVANGVKSSRHIEMLRLVGQFLRDSGYK